MTKHTHAALADMFLRRLDVLQSHFRRGLGRAWRRYIVAEHRCYPPADGRSWMRVSTASRHAERYVCPECSQPFAPQEERKA